ncbi:MAG: FAD-dependent oxidoreductase [Actinomycetia bacterium]|nr:FAD-dependent oxidoreductase [Actinomycetes bacterium]
MAAEGPGSRPRPAVIIIGAGVSGCACAATLSASGIPVVVLNSALDAVGQPGYGPVVEGGVGGWDRIIETLAVLPPALRSVWLDASAAPDVEAAFFFVDRRMLSIESKRALEGMPGLEFRQGLVIDLKVMAGEPTRRGTAGGGEGDPRRVTVSTAFGETLEAEAVVLAVGLGLGGEVRLGDGVLPGGRYGESSAEGLQGALESLGAVFSRRSIKLGSWFATHGVDCGIGRRAGRGGVFGGVGGADRYRRARLTASGPLRERLEGGGRRAGASAGPVTTSVTMWPAHYPPAVHWSEELRSTDVVVTVGLDGAARPWLSPDGAALGETYLMPVSVGSAGGEEDTAYDADEAGLEEEPVASRLGHEVIGLVVTNVDRTGRLTVAGCPPLPVWIAGRAGGAADYLESLASGVRVARSVSGAPAGCDKVLPPSAVIA